MKALLLDGNEAVAGTLQRTTLARPGGHDEKWLQSLLFAHPEAIPIDIIDPGATMVVPICRELALPKPDATVFLDLLGVTPQGRLVLVECKLWRNPQARREVIAQILEYAALIRRWTYADLTARLKSSLRWTGANPLCDHVRCRVPTLDEARFCVASVPHRADDVVRSNPELRGRTANIDTRFWTAEELADIARVGFGALKVKITETDARFFATEACGSPQLMQSICLQTCFLAAIDEEQAKLTALEISPELRRRILAATSTVCDYSSLIAQMHQGPKTRGTERKVFLLKDGTEGDVYRAVLLALADDPPRMDFPWAEIGGASSTFVGSEGRLWGAAMRRPASRSVRSL